MACDFSCHVSGDEDSMFVGAFNIFVPSGKQDPPAGIKGLGLLNYIYSFTIPFIVWSAIVASMAAAGIHGARYSIYAYVIRINDYQMYSTV